MFPRTHAAWVKSRWITFWTPAWVNSCWFSFSLSHFLPQRELENSMGPPWKCVFAVSCPKFCSCIPELVNVSGHEFNPFSVLNCQNTQKPTINIVDEAHFLWHFMCTIFPTHATNFISLQKPSIKWERKPAWINSRWGSVWIFGVT